MAKRWNVHHGNENLGLKTAREIREALRKGTLDPFDKVSAEGSNIREDLIEVDEIFKESIDDQEDYEYTSIQQMPLTAANQGAAPRARESQPSAQLPVMDQAPSAKVRDPIPRGFDPQQPHTNPPPTAATTPIPGASWRNEPSMMKAMEADSKESKSTQKRYYLIDKSKILGPISALEIQSLFNRGMNQKVKVQRIGSTRSIPVAQFIASYSEDRLKELTDDGKLNQKVSSPSSKVLNELARVANAQKIAKTRKNKTYAIVAGVGLVLGVLIFLIFEVSRPSPASKLSEAREEASDHGEKSKNRPKLLQSQGQQPDEEDEDDDGAIRKKPARPPAGKKATPGTVDSPREKAKPVAPGKPTRKPMAAPTPPAARAQTPKAPPVPAKKMEKDSPIARAMNGKAGIQTIGPLSYSSTALEACSSKCTLTLRDASGASIKAVFFKTAYYDALKKASNDVFLTGNIRKEGGELTMFVQDVR